MIQPALETQGRRQANPNPVQNRGIITPSPQKDWCSWKKFKILRFIQNRVAIQALLWRLQEN